MAALWIAPRSTALLGQMSATDNTYGVPRARRISAEKAVVSGGDSTRATSNLGPRQRMAGKEVAKKLA